MPDVMPKMENFRSRIKGYSTAFPVSQLLANPQNWRIHPLDQQEALAATIKEIGFIAPVTINDVTGNMVDGHLRVVLAMRGNVETLPAIHVELSPEEEQIALLTLDPITNFAVADKSVLENLLQGVKATDQNLLDFLNTIAQKEGISLEELDDFSGFNKTPEGETIHWRVVIENLSREQAEALAADLEGAKVEQYRGQ